MDLVADARPSPFIRGRQHQLKFQLILSEAAALFNWQGSRATTLADVAGSLNLTKTCLYYYVNNKQDLVYQCYVASGSMWLGHAQQASQLKGSGLDKICAMVTAHLDQYASTLRNEAPHFAMLTEVSSLEKAHREDIFQRWSEVFQLCQTMVIQGIDEGTIGDVDPAVITLAVFSIIQWFPVWLNRKHTANIKEVVASVMDIMINGISAQSHQFEQILLPKVSHKSVDSFDREAQKQAKREAFYRVGSIHFNQKGYKGTSLDEIAGSLEVTKGAFYYHIRNKEELLYQCFERTLSIEQLLLEQANKSADSGLAKVGCALQYLVNIQLSDQGPLIRYRSLPSLDESHRKLVLKSSKRNSDNLGAFIRQGFDDGTLRDIDAEIAQHILSGAIEASSDLLEWVKSTNGKQISRDYLNIFINGLTIKPNVN